MIVVRVELWSAVTGNVEEIARMTIDNIGGTQQLGDYRTRTMRGRSAEQLHRAMLKNSLTREGRVNRHQRLREHVWNLVAKALTGMGYGDRVLNDDSAAAPAGRAAYPARSNADA